MNRKPISMKTTKKLNGDEMYDVDMRKPRPTEPDCDGPSHVFETEHEEEICTVCGWVKTEDWFMHDRLEFKKPRNHDIYCGKDYLKKKRYTMAGYRNLADLDIRLNQHLVDELYEIVKYCTGWKEVKKELNKKKRADYLYHLGGMFGDYFRVPEKVFELTTDIIHDKHIGMKFECVLAYCCECLDIDYIWLPLYWSSGVRKKNKKLWEEEVCPLYKDDYPWMKPVALKLHKIKFNYSPNG